MSDPTNSKPRSEDSPETDETCDDAFSRPLSESEMETIRSDVEALGVYYLYTAAKCLSTSSFIARHGVEAGWIFPFMHQEDPEAAEQIRAYERHQKSKAAYSPRKAAMAKVAGILGKVAWDPEVVKSRDVTELCSLIGLCIGSTQNTKSHAVEAFADAFASAWQSIKNRERAASRHASKKATLEDAWRHFKKDKYASLAEGARACANHYRQPGDPTERGFLDYFREQAKAEGLTFKPGRKKAGRPKKKAA